MKRWWQPELVLVLAIPLAALLGGVATLRLADVDLSAEGRVRRTAQVQTAELGPDLAAARAQLVADLRIDRARGEVRVRISDAVAAQGLRLEFVHALRAERDLHARLRARGDEWVAALDPDAGSRWRVELSDPERNWRLVGTLPRGGASLRLRPALDAP